ncbi:cell division protein FtsK, partial [Cutibacterium acnes]
MTSTPLSRPSAASKQTVHNAGPGGAKPAWKSIAAGWSGAVLATGGYAAAADPRWWLPCMGCAVVGSLHARRALRAGRRTETAESARLAIQSAAKVPVRQKVTWNRKKTHPRRL